MDRGSLAPGSIFDSELYPKRETPSPPSPKREPRNPRTAHLRARRHIIGQAHRRSRISPVVSIRKKERECTSKSPMFKTSVKKLGPLARQIAGKPLGEAMVQMRFSKKKAARDVLKHLVLARSTAIVKRGMGLGKGKKGEEKLGAKERERVEEKGVGVGEKVPGGRCWMGREKRRKLLLYEIRMAKDAPSRT
ncbi:uncharacterized protein KY384_006212 [Bacidia gigantensis]|uniref:uncharacterized protein n=1 Tax=Bacidia gigantensis TaxID=2732470 RepID=UPI001D054AF4|nr:uncharacterized protein KY384_006212 [Bacidia gigantensis]KAG8529575.1 hypothetical protein KY384_006212 [Bacidia gigantensis]